MQTSPSPSDTLTRMNGCSIEKTGFERMSLLRSVANQHQTEMGLDYIHKYH